MKFLSIIHDEHGQNIGYRHITLSTVGIPEKIKQLADMGLQITLSISLHAPNDELRKRLYLLHRNIQYDPFLMPVPITLRKPIAELHSNMHLIKDLNDSIETLVNLQSCLKGCSAM